MSYILKLIEKEVSLSDEEGQVVKRLLLEGKTRWLELGEDLINTSQVMALFHEGDPEKYVALPQVPMTEEEKENRRKLLGMIREKMGY